MVVRSLDQGAAPGKVDRTFVRGAAIRPEPSPVSKAKLYWRRCRDLVLLFIPALLFFPLDSRC